MHIARNVWNIGHQSGRCLKAAIVPCQRRLVTTSNSSSLETTKMDNASLAEEPTWPRKIFSGIQPTGALHLGNYLGAIKKWKQLQESKDDVTYCIVNMHSITVPQDPKQLRQNIVRMAATMLACGIDPEKATLFLQSDVEEHAELCWILGSLTTMARLGHLPQYREKTKAMKEIPLGLYVYPVLQAADIMLYKTTHVPVGEDQVQHIQLTQHLAKIFNGRYGTTFPICHAIIEDKEVSRIRSMRDPTKKMSKSDPDAKATIFVTDQPEEILEKVKKALTDFQSEVTYEPEKRPGVSNLIAIHAHVTNRSIEEIIDAARDTDTGKYKLLVAEAIIEHFKPIREAIAKHLEYPDELLHILEVGAEKARSQAQDTMCEVKDKMGLGVFSYGLEKKLNFDKKASRTETPNKISANNNVINSSPSSIKIDLSLQARTFATSTSRLLLAGGVNTLHSNQTNCFLARVLPDIIIKNSKASFSSGPSSQENGLKNTSQQHQKDRYLFKTGAIIFTVLALTYGSYLALTEYAVRETLKKFFSSKRDGG